MSKSTYKLIINLIRNEEKTLYKQIKCFNRFYSINNLNKLLIDVPEDIFASTKEKKTTEIIGYSNDILTEIFKFKINIYYGTTRAYLFLNEDNNFLIEALFKENERIIYKDKELTEYNCSENIKSFILIRCPTKLDILQNDNTNKKKVLIESFIPTDRKKDENSFEISIFNYYHSCYATKSIDIITNDFSIKKIEEQLTNLENFFKDIKDLIMKNDQTIMNYKKIILKYPIKSIKINFYQKKRNIKKRI